MDWMAPGGWCQVTLMFVSREKGVDNMLHGM